MPHRASATDRPAIDWGAMLRTHQRWLRTVVLARVGEAAAVDEVMQEILLAALKQGPDDPAKVAPWLYRLAVLQSLQYRRKQGRRRNLVERYATRNQPHEQDLREVDPLDWLLADERRQLVRTALEQLNRRDAEVLLLKYTEDWSYRDLAEHLGISQSAVEARLHRARKRLRSELAKVQIGSEA